MPPPNGFKTWDEYFRTYRGDGWDRNLPGYTPPDEGETEAPTVEIFDPVTRQWKRIRRPVEQRWSSHHVGGNCPVDLPGSLRGELLSPGECSDCRRGASTYRIDGETVVVHEGKKCREFGRRFESPTGTKAMDCDGWGNGVAFKTQVGIGNERPIELDTAKRRELPERAGDDTSVRFSLLELDKP